MSHRAPRKPTRAFVEEVCRYVRAGAPVETAFRITLGAQWATGFEWMAIGTGESRPELLRRAPYKRLLDLVTKAEAEAEMRHLAILQKGQQQKWSAWWLARRHPEQWSSKDTVEVSVPVNTAAGVVLLPASMAAQIRALKSEPYVDPRMLPEDVDLATEPPVVVEDIIEVRPGCDRPHKDEPETIEGRPPAAIPEVIKRPLVD